MKAPTAFFLALLAAPTLLVPLAHAEDHPDVEVRPCPYPTWGHAVYVNDSQVTTCFTGPDGQEPQVEVRPCPPGYIGVIVIVNGRPMTRCGY